MAVAEPPRGWQDQVHARILRDDTTAFAELCEVALPHLAAFLEGRFHAQDSQLCRTTAIDCLLNYHKNPNQYNSAYLSLFAYLRMSARYDLLSAMDKEQRRKGRLSSLDEMTEQLAISEVLAQDDQEELDSWLQGHTDWSISEIIAALESNLEEDEKAVLWLMLEGVRDTSRYVEVLQCSHLDGSAQRLEVKRAKDRLIKKLQRFGENIHN